VNVVENVPVAAVVAVATWVPLKSTATVSLAPNPAPVTVTFEVGGPAFGFSMMLVVTAAAGEANTPTARTVPAVTASTRDRPRQRGNRVARTLTEPMACRSIRTGPPPPPQEARRPSRPRNPGRLAAGIDETNASGGGTPLAGMSVTARTSKRQPRYLNS